MKMERDTSNGFKKHEWHISNKENGAHEDIGRYARFFTNNDGEKRLYDLIFQGFKNAFNDSCLMCVFVYGGYHALISHFVTRQMI